MKLLCQLGIHYYDCVSVEKDFFTFKCKKCERSIMYKPHHEKMIVLLKEKLAKQGRL